MALAGYVTDNNYSPATCIFCHEQSTPTTAPLRTDTDQFQKHIPHFSRNPFPHVLLSRSIAYPIARNLIILRSSERTQICH